MIDLGGETIISNRLQDTRERRGISAAGLARAVGVSRQTIYAIEAGRFVPNTAVALQLSRALDATVEEIFAIADETLPRPVSADLLHSAPVNKGQPVRICRVNRELVAVPTTWLPAYLPPADGIIESRRERTVRISTAFGSAEDGKRLLLAGCDPALSLLHDALLGSGVEMIGVPVASRRALQWLKQGKVHAAGSHLLDRAAGEYNLPILRRFFPTRSIRVITFASWEQGLVIARRNPKSIRSIADLADRRVCVINREKGSGSRDLLDSSLHEFGIAPAEVNGYDSIAAGHLAAAHAVGAGEADCCIAPRSAARCFGLDFIPLAFERFDLTFSRAAFGSAAAKALMDVLQRSSFRKKLESIAGYDVTHTGDIVV